MFWCSLRFFHVISEDQVEMIPYFDQIFLAPRKSQDLRTEFSWRVGKMVVFLYITSPGLDCALQLCGPVFLLPLNAASLSQEALHYCVCGVVIAPGGITFLMSIAIRVLSWATVTGYNVDVSRVTHRCWNCLV